MAGQTYLKSPPPDRHPKTPGLKLPPGACAFEKKGICSFQCNAQTNWCAQQLCTNGVLTQVLPCFSGFCTAKCGG